MRSADGATGADVRRGDAVIAGTGSPGTVRVSRGQTGSKNSGLKTYSRDRPKVVQRCSYALTGKACVGILVTDLAQFRRKNGRLTVEQVAPGFTKQEVLALTGIDAATGHAGQGRKPLAERGRCRPVSPDTTLSDCPSLRADPRISRAVLLEFKTVA
jgi:hypothetical protein